MEEAREREAVLEAIDELTESPEEAQTREGVPQEEAGLPPEMRRQVAEVAREEIRARMEEGPEPGEGREEGADIRRLAGQAQWLMDAQGVDMVEILREDQRLLQRVAQGKVDMHQAYIEYLGKQDREEGPMPPAIRGGAGRAAVDIGKLSPEKMREMEERLGRGERIVIE